MVPVCMARNQHAYILVAKNEVSQPRKCNVNIKSEKNYQAIKARKQAVGGANNLSNYRYIVPRAHIYGKGAARGVES